MAWPRKSRTTDDELPPLSCRVCGQPLPRKRWETCSFKCGVELNRSAHVPAGGQKVPEFLKGECVPMRPPTDEERALMRVGWELSPRFNAIARSQKRVDG